MIKHAFFFFFRKKGILASLRPSKTARKSGYLFKKEFSLGKSLRPVMIYCHPIREEKIRQLNAISAPSSRCHCSEVTLQVFLWSSSYLPLDQNKFLLFVHSWQDLSQQIPWSGDLALPILKLRNWLFLDVLANKPKILCSVMIREYLNCNGPKRKEKWKNRFWDLRGRWIWDWKWTDECKWQFFKVHSWGKSSTSVIFWYWQAGTCAERFSQSVHW